MNSSSNGTCLHYSLRISPTWTKTAKIEAVGMIRLTEITMLLAPGDGLWIDDPAFWRRDATRVFVLDEGLKSQEFLDLSADCRGRPGNKFHNSCHHYNWCCARRTFRRPPG
jgi:hypothetical protein